MLFLSSLVTCFIVVSCDIKSYSSPGVPSLSFFKVALSSMGEEYRDMTVPFSEKELADLEAFFKTLPSYKDGEISSSDLPAFFKEMRFKRSPEELLLCQNFWDKNFGGQISLDNCFALVKSVHKTSHFFREAASTVDKNKNGQIDADEFKDVLEIILTIDPGVKSLTYEQFVQEADTNRDGKVSIQECADWIEKHSPAPAV